MSIQAKFSSRLIRLMSLSLTVVTLDSLVGQIPAQAQTTFSDVPSDYWAAQFIQALVDRGVIRGFTDGSFRPDEPITRAQFAVLVGQAFDRPAVRSVIRFRDVPSSYWAASAIQTAYTEGFLSGYPGNVFNPAQPMPRAQVLVALASGLQIRPSGTNITVIGELRDYEAIPNRAATRAEAAASIYQGLVATSRAPVVESPYIYIPGGG
jgi:S-layer homology domain